MERPIITTDAVGCRDAVEDGKTGYLCRTRDPADLAEKMEKMILLTPEQRADMGKAGRAKDGVSSLTSVLSLSATWRLSKKSLIKWEEMLLRKVNYNFSITHFASCTKWVM